MEKTIFYLIKYKNKKNLYKIGITKKRLSFSIEENVFIRYSNYSIWENRNIENILFLKHFLFNNRKNALEFESFVKKTFRNIRIDNTEDFFWDNSKENLFNELDELYKYYILNNKEYFIYNKIQHYNVDSYDLIFRKKRIAYKTSKGITINFYKYNDLYLIAPGQKMLDLPSKKQIDNWSISTKNVNAKFIEDRKTLEEQNKIVDSETKSFLGYPTFDQALKAFHGKSINHNGVVEL